VHRLAVDHPESGHTGSIQYSSSSVSRLAFFLISGTNFFVPFVF
jgi:hypothetical protein